MVLLGGGEKEGLMRVARNPLEGRGSHCALEVRSVQAGGSGAGEEEF